MIPERIHTDSESVKYLFRSNSSKKLIVIFSGFSPVNRPSPYSYNYVRTLEDLPYNQLFILDNHGPRGCYYLGEGKSLSVSHTVSSLIKKIVSENNIETLITLGSSKGGTAAIYFGIKHNADFIIAGAPQTKIGDYIDHLNDTSTAEYILGEVTEETISWANNLLYDSLNPNFTGHIYLFTSKKDWQYSNHIVPFENALKSKNISYSLFMSDYDGHRRVGESFKNFFFQIFEHF